MSDGEALTEGGALEIPASGDADSLDPGRVRSGDEPASRSGSAPPSVSAATLTATVREALHFCADVHGDRTSRAVEAIAALSVLEQQHADAEAARKALHRCLWDDRAWDLDELIALMEEVYLHLGGKIGDRQANRAALAAASAAAEHTETEKS